MKGLWLENKHLSLRSDLAMPVLDEDEVLIKVRLAGICSTDLEMVRGYYPFTGIPGHEFTGVVVDANGSPQLEGQRVIGDINISCGNCEFCLKEERSQCLARRTLGIFDYNGVMAEYTKLPARNLVVVPESVPDELAVFAEPAAAALRILEQVHVKPSDRVIVVGAGRLGLLIAQAFKNTGCELKVLVRRKKPAEVLSKLGIDSFLAQEAPSAWANIVVEATGSLDGFSESLRLLKPRGTLVLKSTFAGKSQIDLSKLVVNEVSLIGSRCGNYRAGLRALAQRQIVIDGMIDSVFTLEEGLAAFERAAQPGVLKVLINPAS